MKSCEQHIVHFIQIWSLIIEHLYKATGKHSHEGNYILRIALIEKFFHFLFKLSAFRRVGRGYTGYYSVESGQAI